MGPKIMDNLITETGTAKHAVLFMCGSLNEITKQFAEMLKHCQKKNLHVVDMFFDTSTIKSQEEKCFDQLLDYLKRNKTKIAVVFYSRKDFYKFLLPQKLEPFRKSDKLVLHCAKDDVII